MSVPHGDAPLGMAKKNRSYEPSRSRAPVRLESVRVVFEPDQFAPGSYFKDDPELAERRAEYDKGVFDFCFARAEASVVIEEISQTLTSGGLYGIESDAETEYFEGIVDQEWAALRGVLKAVGVPTSELPVQVDRTWIKWRM